MASVIFFLFRVETFLIFAYLSMGLKLLPSWKPSTTADMVQSNGYPLERHEIQTEQGYILETFRIPKGKNSVETGQRPPLLLQHGFLCSSDCWVLSETRKGLGYRLADEGYDVWIGNDRGNLYSRKHIKMSPNSAEFWNFSFHEMGHYDLPSVIDYILNATGESQLTFVGHSQGSMQFFIMAATRPEYNVKVRVAVALGPVAYLEHERGVIPIIAHFAKFLEDVAKFFKVNHVLDHGFFQHLMGHTFCNEYSIFQPLCADVFSMISGFDSPQLNKTLVKTIADHCPAGCSLKQLIHFGQLINNGGKFTYFDYGVAENIKRYNSSKPPEYDLRLVSTPVMLHYSKNDYLASPSGVEKLAKILPHAARYKVPSDRFNHVDFMWAIDVNPLLYDMVIGIIHSFLHE